MRRTLLFATLLLPCGLAAQAPQLGAQIWIEPGQTPREIDAWFARLESSRMPVARLFMMWSYLQPSAKEWDFTLYDAAFRAAEAHHVGIVATLTPSGYPLHLGGDGTQGVGVTRTAALKAASEDYIRRVVRRYRTSPALDTWLLLNEPGEPPSASPLAVDAFRAWLGKRYTSIAALNIAWGTDFRAFSDVTPPSGRNSWNMTGPIDWTTFWREFQTQQLGDMAAAVRAEDPRHPLHLNPHALVSNLAELSDNLPAWRAFLDTLGCSIHPAWHFGPLTTDRFALGVSYVNDLIGGSIEPKPHWVTELQGGNNISSSTRPMNPTAEETAQWVWTSLGAGARRVIFWLLNARRSGVEAGEWSLLTFQQQPSRRLEISSRIAAVLDDHAELFKHAQPARPPVTLIFSLETLTYEAAFARNDFPGRDRNAQLLELLGIYESLARLGPPPAIKHFDDYAWEATGERRVAILPDVRVLTQPQIERLRRFVSNGNTLLVTGLTGFYDPYGKAWPLAGFPLSRVTGGELKEVSFVKDIFPFGLAELPSHLWFSTITATSGRAISMRDGEVTATDWRMPGAGRVIWIPSPIGLGAWLKDPAPLARFFRQAVPEAYGALPFRFHEPGHSCVVRVLRSGDAYVTVVANGAAKSTVCTLEHSQTARPDVLWGEAPKFAPGQTEFLLEPKSTTVLEWR